MNGCYADDDLACLSFCAARVKLPKIHVIIIDFGILCVCMCVKKHVNRANNNKPKARRKNKKTKQKCYLNKKKNQALCTHENGGIVKQ